MSIRGMIPGGVGGLLGRKSYSAGNFLFQLDDWDPRDAAYLKSVSGGMVKGSILEEQAGPASEQFKHLGAVEVDPITIQVGMAMSRPILQWIRGSWQKDFTRRSGAIVHGDYNGRSQFEQWFTNALIVETKFPTLDGAAKEPAYLSVTLHPEDVELKPGDQLPMMGHMSKAQKNWQPNSFAIYINGIDCRHVSKIDSFTVKQNVKPMYTGTARFPELEPTGVTFSNLTLYVSSSHAFDFARWYQSFIVKGGRRDSSVERDGWIEFLGPRGLVPLFVVNLNSIGIHSMDVETSDANSEMVKRMKVELYVETMSLEMSPLGFI